MWLTRVRRVSYSVTASLGLALLGTSCTAGTASSPATTHITVGALPVVDNVGLYIAADEGIFKRFGLSVTIKQMVQSTMAIPEMKSGAITSSAAPTTSPSWRCRPATRPSSVPAADGGGHVRAEHVRRADAPVLGITKPANLAGKTIAVNLIPNVQTLTINAILRADGLNPSSVHYVVIPFPAMVDALQAHQVDAISAVEPFATAAELNTGALPVLDQCQGPTDNLPLSSYFATTVWAQQHPAVVLAFQKAMAQAQAIADGSREVVEKTILTYIPKLTKMEAAILALDTFPTSVDAIQLQRVADLMYSGHLLVKQFLVGPLLTK